MRNTAQTPFEDRGVRVKEAAHILGISTSTLWRWTRQGLLKCVRLPGKITVWKMSEIQRFLKMAE